MTTTLELPPEIDRRLDKLAAETGLSKAYYLHEVIERGLEDVEDYYLATQVLERVRSGEEGVFSLDDVIRDRGLAD